MAELSGPVDLIAVEKGHSLIFTESYDFKKSVLVTRGKRHVCVYDVADSHPLNSWTLGSGQDVTNGAVFDDSTNQIVALISHQYIRRWSPEDTDTKKSKRLTLPNRAFKLISFKGCSPLILYTDGTLAWLNKYNEIFGKPIATSSKSLILLDYISFGNSVYLSLLMVQDSEKTHYIYTIEKGKAGIEQKELSFGVDLSNVTACFQATANRISLLALCNKTGQLTVTKINNPSSGVTKSLQKLPINNETSCSISSLGSTSIVVFGLQSQSNNEVGVGIWDTRLGVCLTWTSLDKSTLNDYKVLNLPGHLIVSSTKGCSVLNYKSTPSSLGAAIGKFNSPVRTETSDKSPCELFLERLIEPKKTPTKGKFDEQFRSFMNELQERRSPVALSVQNKIVALVERLVSDDKIWSQEHILALIQKSLVPSSVCAVLVKSISQRKDIKLQYAIISCLIDIPEAAIVECLNFFLGEDDKSYDEIEDEVLPKLCCNGDAESCTFGAVKAGCIKKTLSLPYNDVFMVEYLKQTEFQKCLDLLQYLHHLMEVMPLSTIDSEKETFSFLQAVDWINMIMDVHFTQLVLSIEARQILVNLHQTVEKNVKYCDELAGLENILSQIKEKCALPQKQNLGLYNIHVLHVY